MPSPEGLLPVFYASTTIACLGYLSLLAQIILNGRKSTPSVVDDVVKLSAVTTEDEAQKPTNPDSQPSGPGDAEHGSDPPNAAESKEQADTKLLHDEMSFLNSEFQAAMSTETTPEIVNAICIYLSAAGNLLRLHRRLHCRGNTRRTDAGLNCKASRIIKQTTADTASLRALRNTARRPRLIAALLTGGLSQVAVWTAAASYTAERRALVIGEQHTVATIISFSPACAGPWPDAETMPLSLLLVALGSSAAVQALVPALVDRYTDDRPTGLAFAFPASIAITMVVALRALGIPREVMALGLGCSVVLIVATMPAAVSSVMRSNCEELARWWEVVGEQNLEKEG